MKNGYEIRLLNKYRNEIIPDLMKKDGYTNPMQVPRLEKIVVNMGVGEGAREAKLLDYAIEDLTIITGQKPAMTRAKKSIAGFKIREGMAIGAKVTMRGKRMYEFLDRLISIAFPRIRDFRGLSAKAFDGRGNYSVGLNEQLVFPEIDYDKVQKIRGMDVTIVTSSKTDDGAYSLLKAFGMPIKEKK